MANDAKNVKLGVCRVLFDGKDLGFTKGGVSVTVATETHEVQLDQTGQTPVNEFIMGRTVTVSCPLAETTLENLAAIMPGATLVVDAESEAARVDVSMGVGVSLLDWAKQLTLHPIALPDADKSEDFTIFRAATPGAMDFAYKLDEERIFSCEFKGYPNEDNLLFAFGDPQAGASTAVDPVAP